MSQGKLILTVITYLIAYAIDPMILTLSFNLFLKPKYKNFFLYMGLCFGGIYFLMLVKQSIFFFVKFDLGLIFILFVFFYMIAIVYFLYGADFRKKVTVIIVYYICALISEAVFSVAFVALNISNSIILNFGLRSAVITLLMRMTDILVWIIIKYFYELINVKGKKVHAMFGGTMIFVVSCLIFIYFYGITNVKVILLICVFQTTLYLICITYAIIFLKNMINREEAAKKRAELSESKLAFLEYSREKYEEIKLIRHDMKRHFNTLLELNRRKEYDAVEKYLIGLSNELIASDEIYVCDNLILAVALSNAQRKATMNGIRFAKSITANEFPFTDTELNSVITNILDNAFEAVSKVKEGDKYVKFEIRKINEEEMMFYCENTYRKEEYENVPFLSTTKWNKDNHGYGTRIVRKIVQRYGGTVVYWNDSQKFYVKIIVRGNELNENSHM